MQEVKAAVDHSVDVLEQERELGKSIVCVDLDAFFAAVEERDDPSLKGKPMAVGGMGMLSTANYEARKYGVRSAMPGFIGLQLCPQLQIIRPHFAKYKEASQQVQEVLKQYDPSYEMCSMDEGFLDLTQYLESSSQTVDQVVQEMRLKIHKETQLTVSAGIAPNRLLAKIGSDFNKPNGQYNVGFSRLEVLEFVRKLPIRKVSGIGKVMERQLKGVLQVETCQQLYDQRYKIRWVFSQISAEFLLRASLGIGSSDVDGQDPWERKSISTERTFGSISEKGELLKKLRQVADMLAEDLQDKNLSGKCVTLKIKSHTFEVTSRSKSVPRFVWQADDLYNIAKPILESCMPCELRLMGLKVSVLADVSEAKSQDISQFLVKVPSIKDVPAEVQHQFWCPICSNCVVDAALTQDNVKFNQHIDECLSKDAVRELTQKRPRLK